MELFAAINLFSLLLISGLSTCQLFIYFCQAITAFFPLSYQCGLGMTCGPSNTGRGIICSIECVGWVIFSRVHQRLLPSSALQRCRCRYFQANLNTSFFTVGHYLSRVEFSDLAALFPFKDVLCPKEDFNPLYISLFPSVIDETLVKMHMRMRCFCLFCPKLTDFCVSLSSIRWSQSRDF